MENSEYPPDWQLKQPDCLQTSVHRIHQSICQEWKAFIQKEQFGIHMSYVVFLHDSGCLYT